MADPSSTAAPHRGGPSRHTTLSPNHRDRSKPSTTHIPQKIKSFLKVLLDLLTWKAPFSSLLFGGSEETKFFIHVQSCCFSCLIPFRKLSHSLPSPSPPPVSVSSCLYFCPWFLRIPLKLQLSLAVSDNVTHFCRFFFKELGIRHLQHTLYRMS